MSQIKRILANRQGYTIDQTILIVAIIAILITLIIVTIGWQLINRTGGTKLGSQFRQMEDANGQFYSSQHMWPHQAISMVTGANNALALSNAIPSGVTWNSSVIQGELRNLLPGFPVNAGGNVSHNYGNGGSILMMPGTVGTWHVSGSNEYMVIQFSNMPVSEAKEADRAIDGSEDPQSGRLVYQPATSDCIPPSAHSAAPTPASASGASTVNVCYAANTVE